MNKQNRDILKEKFSLSERILDRVEAAEREIYPQFSALDEITAYNQYKVLAAFQKNRVSDTHFAWNTGYGEGDVGRAVLERVYADAFGAEAALVRPLIVSGTHALAITLLGLLRPGDELIYCAGGPYDTLEEVIGIRGEKGQGSLADYGISYKQVELLPDGSIDLEGVKNAVSGRTKVLTVQRAMGYGWRRAIGIEQIEEWVKYVKSLDPGLICMVDNCYCEFLDYKEPAEVGADITAGSLIKNPGGGMALSGGYVAGKAELIHKIQYRMTSPGIGGELGLMFGQTRTMLRGFFSAPKVVNGAVKGALLCAKLFGDLGFEICPGVNDKRSDIIQAVRLGSEEAVSAFSEGIQKAAPVDAHVSPVFGEMAGYGDKIIMACGAFVQGSSIELSCDAPLREPYNVYFQGGLSYEHSKLGVAMALQSLCDRGLAAV